MKALTWQGTERVEIRDVPDPVIQQPTDAIVRVTSTANCGSDLRLYKLLAPYLEPGDVLGHEFMGMVEEVGSDFGPVKLPHDGRPDERYLYLSDIFPTAWQGVEYPDVPEGGTLAVIGLGPVGQLAVASARQRGIERIIAVDLVPERLAKAEAAGATVLDASEVKNLREAVWDLTDGRGADGVLEAVGMEAHGSPVAGGVAGLAAKLPKPLARATMEEVGIDQLAALYSALELARRGGTVSISGVYGGAADPMPMLSMFDKGLTLRMGQCHVRAWTDELLEIANREDDVLGLESLATHRLPLDEAPQAYETFQKKEDGCINVVLTP